LTSAKNIFVTGGAGVIGQQLVPMLLEAGHNVFVGDLKEKPSSFSSDVNYLKGDLNDLQKNVFSDLNIQILIHLAATFERSLETFQFYSDNFENNIKLSNHVMSIARVSDHLERVLFASSYLVYDKKQYLFEIAPSVPTKLGPNSEVSARNLIGSAKLFHESELKYIASFPETAYSIVIPRIYRGYGLGSRDIISRWVRASLNQEEIVAYDLEGAFDYIYCKDSAIGIMKLACQSDYAGIVDLGTGRSRKVNDVLLILKSAFSDLKIKEGDSTGLIEASEANIDNLKSITGWSPTFDLENAIAEIIVFETNMRAN
jgi:carbamoyl-phosphate synthase large subunit